jgi:hypothetical protein
LILPRLLPRLPLRLLPLPLLLPNAAVVATAARAAWAAAVAAAAAAAASGATLAAAISVLLEPRLHFGERVSQHSLAHDGACPPQQLPRDVGERAFLPRHLHVFHHGLERGVLLRVVRRAHEEQPHELFHQHGVLLRVRAPLLLGWVAGVRRALRRRARLL